MDEFFHHFRLFVSFSIISFSNAFLAKGKRAGLFHAVESELKNFRLRFGLVFFSCEVLLIKIILLWWFFYQ